MDRNTTRVSVARKRLQPLKGFIIRRTASYIIKKRVARTSKGIFGKCPWIMWEQEELVVIVIRKERRY